VFTDNDTSAASGKPRKQYARMCEAIARGDYRHVVVWSNDRLHRRFDDVVEFAALVEKHGVTVETVTSGQLDFDLASERSTMTYISSVLAAQEVARRKARINEKHRELAVAGKVAGGGKRGFGYEEGHLVIREDEAQVVREVAQRLLDGEGLNALARELTARGVRGVNGAAIKPTNLRAMMLSPRLAGVRLYDGESYPAVWPGILSETTHRRLVRMFTERKGRSEARAYALTGILYCGACDRRMVGSPTNGKAAYQCRYDAGSCGRSVKAEPVEEWLAEVVHAYISSGALADRIATATDGHLSDALDRVRALENERDELAAMRGAGEITTGEWRTMRAGLLPRLEDAQADLRRLESSTGPIALARSAEGWQAAWEDASARKRAAMLGTLLERVNVGPGQRGRHTFDPARFDVIWR
jgi:site-specific DNA recombinase